MSGGDNRVVLGLLRGELFDVAPESLVEPVMESGPATIRPHVPAETTAESMRKWGVEHTVVTTLDGRLVGLLRRKDVEKT